MTINDQREDLIERLTDSVGNLLSVITIDAQSLRPLPGKAAILVNPPEIDFEGWEIQEARWSIIVIAGTMATQVDALGLILPVIEKLQADHINMHNARPVTYTNGSGSLAAYQITLNP